MFLIVAVLNISTFTYLFFIQLDVVVFAQLAQIYFIDKEVTYTLRDYMTESCPNLVGLVNRMKERCFPDWDDICTTLDLNSHLPKPAPEDAKDNKEAVKDEKEGAGDQEKEPDEKDIEKEKVMGRGLCVGWVKTRYRLEMEAKVIWKSRLKLWKTFVYQI